MARRFKFRLETVRKIRGRERDAQRLVVAEKARDAETARSRIAGLSNEVTDEVQQARDARPGGRLELGRVRMHLLHRAWLQEAIETARAEFGEREAVLRAERSKLAEASKRFEVIEKLRHRQWCRHRLEVGREEQTAADEAAQQSFFRRLRKQVETS